MLYGRKFNIYLQNSIWAKAANTTMFLENHMITPNRNISPFQQFVVKGKKSILPLIQIFVKMCIATYKDNSHWAILANCSTFSFWVGYAEGHPTVHTKFSTPKQKRLF